MKKIIIYFLLCIFLSGCLSDNNKNTEASYVENEVDTDAVFVNDYEHTNQNIETTYIENEVDENIIFVNDFKHIDENKNFTIDYDTAIDKIIDTNISFQSAKFMVSTSVIFNNETYYVIDIIYDNGDTVSKDGTFWVNTENGDVYIYYDPTLQINNTLSQFIDTLQEDDGRTRLIKLN